MMTVKPLEVDGSTFTAIQVDLPKTNLIMITNDVGYIMCGALDIDLINDKLAEREVIAGRAVGVRTFEDLLNAPLEKITNASKKYGWEKGMTGKNALLKLS